MPWHLLASFFHPTPTPALEATSPLGFASLLAKPRAWAVSWIWKSRHRLLWNSFFLRTSRVHYLTCPRSMSPERWLAASSQIYRLWGWRQPETGNDSQGHPVELCVEILPYFLNPNPKMSSEALINRGTGQMRGICSQCFLWLSTSHGTVCTITEHMHTYAPSVYASVHVIVGARAQPWLLFLGCYQPCFLGTEFLTSLELFSKLGWLASECLASTCLHSPVLGSHVCCCA